MTGKKETIDLIPEFLLMTGLDEDMRNSDTVKREMIGLTKLDPQSN